LSIVLTSPTTMANKEKNNLDTLVQHFWKANKLATDHQEPNYKSEDKKKAKAVFDTQKVRAPHGRFQVAMPFYLSKLQLSDTLPITIERLTQPQQRICKYPELKRRYTEFMQEYATLKDMIPAKKVEQSRPAFYFPYHAVLRKESSTTKLQVVFDGLAKNYSIRAPN
jgi:hypothetical protein